MEKRQPQVSWRGIRGLGNVLRHEYNEVDDSTIQRIIERELEPLRHACVSERYANHSAAHATERGSVPRALLGVDLSHNLVEPKQTVGSRWMHSCPRERPVLAHEQRPPHVA